MKNILTVLTAIGLVLALGTAYTAVADIDAHSLINTLDPSKVPGYVEMETGAVTLAAPGAPFIERGSAAGGMSKTQDTFLNYIDPSKVAGFVELETGAISTGPAAFKAGGSAAGGISKGHDTFLNYIDPSRVAGYVDMETGVVN